MSVISFTPVRQSEEVLALHLAGLDGQGFAESWFYDDNDVPSQLLKGRTLCDPIDGLATASGYDRSEVTHLWDSSAVARVAQIKNAAIARFLETDADWLFLVDSDVVMAPGTVDHLLSADVSVICAVYWTKWTANRPELPNVWDQHSYEFRPGRVDALRVPGHYRVGGLGACTLIHRWILEDGVNFHPVAGVNYWGEDRHFCTRVAARDIPLIACTHADVRHVYRDSDIEDTKRWLQNLSLALSPVAPS